MVSSSRYSLWTRFSAPGESGLAGVTELLSFGEKGLDDLQINPVALERLTAEGRFVMLLEGEDEPGEGDSWPVVFGDRIVFASYEDEEEPVAVAIVAPELAKDPVVLGEVASQDDEAKSGIRIVFGPGSPMTQIGREKGGFTLWDAAVLLCRVLALYVPLRLLASLQGGGAGALLGGTQGSQRLINAAFLVLFAAVGLVLWSKAPQIADAMIAPRRRGRTVAPGQPVDFQALIFSTVGLLIVAESLPALAMSTAMFFVRPEGPPELQRIFMARSNYVPQLIGTLARLLLGLWLLFGSRNIARWISSKRPSYAPIGDDADE